MAQDVEERYRSPEPTRRCPNDAPGAPLRMDQDVEERYRSPEPTRRCLEERYRNLEAWRPGLLQTYPANQPANPLPTNPASLIADGVAIETIEKASREAEEDHNQNDADLSLSQVDSFCCFAVICF